MNLQSLHSSVQHSLDRFFHIETRNRTMPVQRLISHSTPLSNVTNNAPLDPPERRRLILLRPMACRADESQAARGKGDSALVPPEPDAQVDENTEAADDQGEDDGDVGVAA